MRLNSAFMAVGLAVLLSACGEVRNPLAKPPAFIQTQVPADFAVVVEQATDSYYTRQTTHQVITASDMMSRTTFTYYRDYNNTIANRFTTEHPVNAAQLQAMWNEVQRYKLLNGAATWYYWEGHMDDYRRNERMMEIRAGGKSQTFKQLNHWSYKLRELALDVEAARLPITQGAGIIPTTQPAMTPENGLPAPSATTVPEVGNGNSSTTQPGALGGVNTAIQPTTVPAIIIVPPVTTTTAPASQP